MCSENRDADQLCSYCTADLHLCFCLIIYVFSCYSKSGFLMDVGLVTLVTMFFISDYPFVKNFAD